MKVEIYSRKAMEELLKNDPPQNTAVISFFTPVSTRLPCSQPIDYKNRIAKIFQVGVHDIDIEVLEEFGLTYDTYFPQVNQLAEFIYSVKAEGLDIICQCDYGQSRSAACAAAILEHFYKRGISVFANYKYCPNQLIYNQVFDALENYTLSDIREVHASHGRAPRDKV